MYLRATIKRLYLHKAFARLIVCLLCFAGSAQAELTTVQSGKPVFPIDLAYEFTTLSGHNSRLRLVFKTALDGELSFKFTDTALNTSNCDYQPWPLSGEYLRFEAVCDLDTSAVEKHYVALLAEVRQGASNGARVFLIPLNKRRPAAASARISPSEESEKEALGQRQGEVVLPAVETYRQSP